MKKHNAVRTALISSLVFASLLFLTGAGAPAAENSEAKAESTAAAERSQAGEADAGHFERGGQAIGQGYGHAGKEFGRGTAGFATGLVKGEFGEAGHSMGHGGAEFGKGVGHGTARGFKQFGLAFVKLGKKVDRAVSGDDEL